MEEKNYISNFDCSLWQIDDWGLYTAKSPIYINSLGSDFNVWFDVDGMRMTALYHPSALLRDPGKRPETFDDLKSLQREIGRVCERTELNRPW